MMKQTPRERLLGYVVLAGLIWMLSQLALNFLNNCDGLFESYGHYNNAVYGLMMAYVSSLLLFDTLLWFAKSLEADRVMKRYWAICCVLMVIWVLYQQPLMASESGGSILATFLIWLITPFVSMLPMSCLSLLLGFGMKWSVMMTWHGIIVLLLSAVHFLYFYGLSNRHARGKQVSDTINDAITS